MVSAHRTPERIYAFAKGAEAAGFKVIIAGAGGAAHLPGMTASLTDLPVLGVPVRTKTLDGLDSLLSIVQMPGGVPVGTLAIGEAGARNAGLLAAQILALSDPALAARLAAFAPRQTEAVPERSRTERSALSGFPLRAGSPSASWAAASWAACWRWPRPGWASTSRCSTPSPTRRPRRVAARAIIGAYDDPDGAATPGRASPTWSPSSSRTCRPRRSTILRSRRRGRSRRARRALAIAQDRLDEKTFLNEAGAPTVAFAAVDEPRRHRRGAGAARRARCC